MIRMPVDRVQLPNCGVAHLEIDAETLVRIGEVPTESRRGGRSAILVPPRGRTGILAVPLGVDSETEMPQVRRLTTFLLRERAHFCPSPDRAGTALIRRRTVPYDHDALTFELLILSSSIANLVEKIPPAYARDQLETIGTKISDSWYADSLLDQLADLLLKNSEDRSRFLLERSPRRRIGQLMTCVRKAIGDPEALGFGKVAVNSTDAGAEEESDAVKRATVSHAPPPPTNDSDPSSDVDDTSQSRAGSLRQRIRASLPPTHVERADRELDNLLAMQTYGAERRLRMLELCPWESVVRPPLDPAAFRTRIDEEHFGHRALKAHLSDIAVRWNFAQQRGVAPIERAVLLVGPPGVGKTSIARAFAAALERPFGQLSLAGVRDVITLIGTVQNFSDSVTGAIMNAVVASGAPDPVILLDELDRMGNSNSGHPSANVLLSLLDNSDGGCFTDAFLGIPFNVGKVIWIATANDVDNIPEALLDRMEVFTVPAYNTEDRMAIAKDRLVPRIITELGLQTGEVSFTEDGISALLARCADSSSLRGVQAEIRRTLTAALADVEADRTPVVIDHEFVHLRTRRK